MLLRLRLRRLCPSWLGALPVGMVVVDMAERDNYQYSKQDGKVMLEVKECVRLAMAVDHDMQDCSLLFQQALAFEELTMDASWGGEVGTSLTPIVPRVLF